MLARIYVFRSLCVYVVRFPTTVSNDAVLSKIFIIITENILYNIIYSMVLFILRGKTNSGKLVKRASIFISVVCCGRTYIILLLSHTTLHIILYNIYYSELWVLSLIDLSENSRSINFISNSLKGGTST